MENTQTPGFIDELEPDYIQLVNHLEKCKIKRSILSDEMDKSKSWVTKILNGEIELSQETKERIEKILSFSNFKFKSSVNEKQS